MSKTDIVTGLRLDNVGVRGGGVGGCDGADAEGLSVKYCV